jgi:acetyl-CoA carboxylase carboxyl transferase subunit beta
MRLARGKNAPLGDAFLQCSNCKKTLFRREFEQNLMICPHCNHHHRLTAEARLELVFDEGTFVELDTELHSLDTLTFPDYAEKLEAAMAKTKKNDGMSSGTAELGGQKCAVAVSDFSFMGGSMGSVAGEKVTRTLERAAKERIPAIIFCASGGARMQEGLLSLMQMAKTTAAAEKCREAGAPFIAVFTDPTMAGVLASYASIADVIFAEPKALVGFAGARVSKQAQVVKAPDNFQSAEFCLQKGMIDKIVPRRELRETLLAMVSIFMGGKV